MSRIGGWLYRGKIHTSSSTHSLDSLAETLNLEAALRAAELILDDDISGAERDLGSGTSSFHKLVKGVICFLQATLGFEQEVMQAASVHLADAETAASNDQSRAQRDSQAFRSEIYNKGAEFALCAAQAQIMGAVVGVLNENLTDAIRGFYKLRKAYGTLNGLMEMEDNFMKVRGVSSLDNSRETSTESLYLRSPPTSTNHVTSNHAPNHPSVLHQANNVRDDDDTSDEDEFFEVDDTNEITRSYTGKIETNEVPFMRQKLEGLPINNHTTIDHDDLSQYPTPSTPTAPKINSLNFLNHGPDSEIFSHQFDVFIHSGTNFCFGLLSLMISVIPPAFGKLLYIVGIRGDRERGIRMLWQASKFSNINGGLAGLVLLGWYNGLVRFCDIVPDSDPSIPDDVEGYPMLRLEGLLATMRKRYPKSAFWLLEEARMETSHRRLDNALAKLEGSSKSQLKQLEALHMFEKSLSAMAAHRYELCSDSFIRCCDLNSWSRALYYYISGAAHLSMYRDLKDEDGKEAEAAQHAKLAEKHFRNAPTHIGKKKIMGKQLPFDVFVNRKITKWEQRAKEQGCDFVDAAGVSPLEEMVYLWNGYKKMDSVNLETSLRNLAWSERQPRWADEELDEKAICALLRATVLRNLRRHDEAKSILMDEIICHDRQLFKGGTKDDWTPPTAHYEMAVNLWMERSAYTLQHGKDILDPASANKSISEYDIVGDAELVAECKEWVDKARAWEKYELDARMGMKITTASGAIKQWQRKYPELVNTRR